MISATLSTMSLVLESWYSVPLTLQLDGVATSMSPRSVATVARPARLAIRLDARCFQYGAVLGGCHFFTTPPPTPQRGRLTDLSRDSEKIPSPEGPLPGWHPGRIDAQRPG